MGLKPWVNANDFELRSTYFETANKRFVPTGFAEQDNGLLACVDSKIR